MDSTQKLIKKAKEMGINTDEVIYSVCIGDVIEVIAKTLVDNMGVDEEYVAEYLIELIEVGVSGCKNIDWSFPTETYLIDNFEHEVFVYGTLRKECVNHYVMKEAKGRYIGKGVVNGYEMYTNGGFPMVIRGEGTVVGELYEVQNLYRLDALEGYPHLYIRETTEVELESGEKVKALIYTQSHNAEAVRQNRIKIAEGDWVEWVKKHRKESGICA